MYLVRIHALKTRCPLSSRWSLYSRKKGTVKKRNAGSRHGRDRWIMIERNEPRPSGWLWIFLGSRPAHINVNIYMYICIYIEFLEFVTTNREKNLLGSLYLSILNKSIQRIANAPLLIRLFLPFYYHPVAGTSSCCNSSLSARPSCKTDATYMRIALAMTIDAS